MANSISATKKRVEYFDVFRGIGIVFMLMGHVDFGPKFNIYIHAFHMPIFFFVSGCFYNPDKFKSAKEYIIHELKALIVPYTVFVLLCQPLHYLYTHEFDFKYFILSYFSSNHNRIDVAGAYWFLLCLFSAKIIFYFIDKYTDGILEAVLILLLTLAGNIMTIHLPLCIDSALSCLLIIYVGYILKKNKDNEIVKKIFAIPWWILIILFVVNMIGIFYNGGVNVRTNRYEIIPLYWINCFTAILIYINLSKILENIKFKPIQIVCGWLKYFGKNSIVYLVLNELVIFAVSIVLNRVVKIAGIGVENAFVSYSAKVLILIATMIVLALFTELFNRTKLKVLLGRF